MSSLIFEFIEEGMKRSFPIEIILLMLIILLSFPVAFFFYRLMRKQQKAIEKQTKALEKVVEQTALVMVSIQDYIRGDENVTEAQAILVYEDMLLNTKADLMDLYKRTKTWLGTRDIIEDPELQKQLEGRIFNHFEAAESNLMDKLRSFKYDGRWFSEYQMTYSNIWRHIADGMYSTLAVHENGVSEYLDSRFEKCINCFNLWLKDAIGYEQRNPNSKT